MEGITNLTTPEEAIEWVRSRHPDLSRPSLRNLFPEKPDYRLTPESLPLLLDILTSQAPAIGFTAMMALASNGALITSNETEENDATLVWVICRWFVHERPMGS